MDESESYMVQSTMATFRWLARTSDWAHGHEKCTQCHWHAYFGLPRDRYSMPLAECPLCGAPAEMIAFEAGSSEAPHA